MPESLGTGRPPGNVSDPPLPHSAKCMSFPDILKASPALIAMSLLPPHYYYVSLSSLNQAVALLALVKSSNKFLSRFTLFPKLT